jgi:hypothetical protein
MGMRRGAVSLIVNELLKDGSIFEGATGDSVRGRKPTFLYIDSRRRVVVAIDIRVSQTSLMLADLVGQPIGGVITIPPSAIPRSSSSRSRRASSRCSPITGRSSLHRHRRRGARHGRAALDARAACADARMARRGSARDAGEATGIPVEIENSGRVCALAQLWAMHGGEARPAISSSSRRRTASAWA